MALLTGKVALVTGGGRGLGRAHALALAAEGASVVVNDLGGSMQGEGADAAPAEAVADEIVAAGGKAFSDTRSVADWNNAREIICGAVSRFGRLDIIVNNAGISRPSRFGSIDEGDWDLTFGVNAKATAALMDAAARHWTAAGPEGGRAIVNTASPAAACTLAQIGLYSASKATVVTLSEAAAEDLAPLGVRVNAIAPIARTRLIESVPEMVAFMAEREGFDHFSPDNVSRLVIYLASPLCKFTGRLVGIEGDTVYLFNQRSAEVSHKNDGAAWRPELLAKTFAPDPPEQQFWALFPGGRIQVQVPSNDALAALNQFKK